MNMVGIAPERAFRAPTHPESALLPPPESGLRMAFEGSMSGIAMLDAAGRILHGNPALSAIVARPGTSLTGRCIVDLVAAEDRPKVERALLELRTAGRPAIRMFIGCPRHDGAIASVDASFWTWTAGDGAGGFLVELRDVSALRKSEDELHRIQNQMLQTEKMASIGQLAAGVAHEINNPLAYVYSNLHTLGDYVDDMLRLIGGYEEAERLSGATGTAWDGLRAVKCGVDFENIRGDAVSLVEESREGIQRVKKIVQDLKEFSHANSNDEWTIADLHKGLDSTLNIARNEFKYKARIEKVYGALPLVECVPSQINQVFMNILINAGQAITENGVIRIATGVAGDEVWVEITDNGSGIPTANLTRIFDPFFTTKQVGVGTGLGLSLSYSIVKKHHGRIEVESAPGGGACFRIWLPIRPAAR